MKLNCPPKFPCLPNTFELYVDSTSFLIILTKSFPLSIATCLVVKLSLSKPNTKDLPGLTSTESFVDAPFENFANPTPLYARFGGFPGTDGFNYGATNTY